MEIKRNYPTYREISEWQTSTSLWNRGDVTAIEAHCDMFFSFRERMIRETKERGIRPWEPVEAIPPKELIDSYFRLKRLEDQLN